MKHNKNKKVYYSLFSFRTVIGIFIATAMSVFYTLYVFAKIYTSVLDKATTLDKWQLAIVFFLFLCLIYTVVILIYRKLVVKNPVLRILDATEKIGEGDFSVRLPVKKNRRFFDEYDVMSQNINAMAEELSGIETLRQDFIANVSHEFKAPLAVMQSCCTIIMQPELSEQDRLKYAKHISDASIRMASMITNILKLNKIESRKILEKNDLINITELLREEIVFFESIWEAKGIEIELNSDEAIEIHSDRELLSLMIRNLLSNAFKFTPPDGRVTVTVIDDKSHVSVSIADSGEGVAQDKLERIFEKFYQADTSHTTEGNGLGLALVKSICEILGYHISVNSTPGEGCCFTVQLKE